MVLYQIVFSNWYLSLYKNRKVVKIIDVTSVIYICIVIANILKPLYHVNIICHVKKCVQFSSSCVTIATLLTKLITVFVVSLTNAHIMLDIKET